MPATYFCCRNLAFLSTDYYQFPRVRFEKHVRGKVLLAHTNKNNQAMEQDSYEYLMEIGVGSEEIGKLTEDKVSISHENWWWHNDPIQSFIHFLFWWVYLIYFWLNEGKNIIYHIQSHQDCPLFGSARLCSDRKNLWQLVDRISDKFWMLNTKTELRLSLLSHSVYIIIMVNMIWLYIYIYIHRTAK